MSMYIESPILYYQPTFNRGKIIACSECLKDLVIDLKEKVNLITNDNLNIDVPASIKYLSNSKYLRCGSFKNCCNELYCSELCKDRHFIKSGHKFLCEETIQGKRLVNYCRSNDADIILFAIKLLFSSVYDFIETGKLTNLISSCSTVEIFHFVIKELFNSYTKKEDFNINDEFQDDMISVIHEAWVLFCANSMLISQEDLNIPLPADVKISFCLEYTDWERLLYIVSRLGFQLSVDGDRTNFFDKLNLLSQDDRSYLLNQPEMRQMIYRAYSLEEPDLGRVDFTSIPTERMISRLIQYSSNKNSDIYSSNLTAYVLLKPDSALLNFDRSCMPNSELVISFNPTLIVKLNNYSNELPTIPFFKNCLRVNETSNDYFNKKSFVLQNEILIPDMFDTCSIFIPELSNLKFCNDMVESLKNMNLNRKFTCNNCIRCKFEKSPTVKRIEFIDVTEHEIWTISSSEISISENVDGANLVSLGSYYLSIQNYSLSAVVFYSVIIQLRLQTLNSLNSQLLVVDALHALASILLELASSQFDISPVNIRTHLRSACKLWYLCSNLKPQHKLAKGQIDKLLAFGNFDFLNQNLASNDKLIEPKTECIDYIGIKIKPKIKISSLFNGNESVQSESIFISKDQIISKEDSSWIIKECESYAGVNKWNESRHYSVPTTDIPLHEINSVYNWFSRSGFKEKLISTLQAQFSNSFDGTNDSIFINDAFIVKYSHDFSKVNIDSQSISHNNDIENNLVWGNKSFKLNSNGSYQPQWFLPLHTDQSTHSVIIALNEPPEFTGGGTYFSGLEETLDESVVNVSNSVVSLQTGQMLSFQGCKLLHGGEPITSGTRYIMTFFLFLGSNEKRKKYHQNNSYHSLDDKIQKVSKKENDKMFEFNFNKF